MSPSTSLAEGRARVRPRIHDGGAAIRALLASGPKPPTEWGEFDRLLELAIEDGAVVVYANPLFDEPARLVAEVAHSPRPIPHRLVQEARKAFAVQFAAEHSAVALASFKRRLAECPSIPAEWFAHLGLDRL